MPHKSTKAISTAKSISNEGQRGTNKADAEKRAALSSPEGAPHRKRSAFGDITNALESNDVANIAKKKDVTLSAKKKVNAKNENDVRVTRSKSTSSKSLQQAEASPTQERRKSKRLIERKMDASASDKEVSKSCLEESGGQTISQDTVYESAQESLNIEETSLERSDNEVSKSEFIDAASSPAIPEGVEDFDREIWRDPFSVSFYAQDIFKYFKERELKFIPRKYLTWQPELTRNMRAVLVDWMAEVQESFEMNHETLYLAVRLVDLYLSRERLSKAILQLLGTAAMFVAAKFDERIPPTTEDFLYICDDAYNRKQLLRMEIKLLKCIGFDLGVPLSYTFLRRYARCSKQSMELLTLARYILELSLMEYDMMEFSDSITAAASLSLALRMTKKEPWNSTLQYYTTYCESDLTDLVHRLNSLVINVQSKPYKTIVTKYSHKVFYEVAKIPPLDGIQ